MSTTDKNPDMKNWSMGDKAAVARIDAGISAATDEMIRGALANYHQQFLDHAKGLLFRSGLGVGTYLNGAIKREAEKRGLVLINGVYVQAFRGYVPQRIRDLLSRSIVNEEIDLGEEG